MQNNRSSRPAPEENPLLQTLRQQQEQLQKKEDFLQIYNTQKQIVMQLQGRLLNNLDKLNPEDTHNLSSAIAKAYDVLFNMIVPVDIEIIGEEP
jgi:uncharacterized protein YxjI